MHPHPILFGSPLSRHDTDTVIDEIHREIAARDARRSSRRLSATIMGRLRRR